MLIPGAEFVAVAALAVLGPATLPLFTVDVVTPIVEEPGLDAIEIAAEVGAEASVEPAVVEEPRPDAIDKAAEVAAEASVEPPAGKVAAVDESMREPFGA